ncbi:MAG: hypothetical protein FWD67_01840 [Betaproteobacteria bacterium]|nr:hypothetical protein [Betaproteobacteria bacterium]
MSGVTIVFSHSILEVLMKKLFPVLALTVLVGPLALPTAFAAADTAKAADAHKSTAAQSSEVKKDEAKPATAKKEGVKKGGAKSTAKDDMKKDGGAGK